MAQVRLNFRQQSSYHHSDFRARARNRNRNRNRNRVRNRNRNRIHFILIFTAILSSPLPAADFFFRNGVDNYAGTTDTSIYDDKTTNSAGGAPHLFVGSTQFSQRRRALIRFDLTSLPANYNFTSAALELTVYIAGSRATTNFYTLHRLRAPWGEGVADPGQNGGFGVPANPGDATWSHRFWNTSAWANPGGDYLPTPSATLQIGPDANPSADVVFRSDGIRNDVRHWRLNPAQNFGWILIGDELEAWNAHRFFSSEAQTLAQRPRLHVVTGAQNAALHWLGYP